MWKGVWKDGSFWAVTMLSGLLGWWLGNVAVSIHHKTVEVDRRLDDQADRIREMEQRLKHRTVDRGPTEAIPAQNLPTTPKDD